MGTSVSAWAECNTKGSGAGSGVPQRKLHGACADMQEAVKEKICAD